MTSATMAMKSFQSAWIKQEHALLFALGAAGATGLTDAEQAQAAGFGAKTWRRSSDLRSKGLAKFKTVKVKGADKNVTREGLYGIPVRVSVITTAGRAQLKAWNKEADQA